jgi:predicted Fe-Mo cluster-binding NifX family protein
MFPDSWHTACSSICMRVNERVQMTKTAFSYWNRRIAPVFDIAQRLRVLEIESGRVIREKEETLKGELPVQKALYLVKSGIGTLVCGAISTPFSEVMVAYGIIVISFIAGDLSEVIAAWCNGGLDSRHFDMPGCTERHRSVESCKHCKIMRRATMRVSDIFVKEA